MEGAITHSKPRTISDILYNFVKYNPTIAAKLAFEIGLLGGRAARGISWNGLRKLPSEFESTLTRPLQKAALRLLPGRAPSLQPHRTRLKKKQTRRPRHKTENTNGKKDRRHNDGNS